MKTLRFILLLFCLAAPVAQANDVSVYVGDCAPRNSHSCVTLGALFGQTFTQIKVDRGILTVTVDGTWTPDAETKAALALTWQMGQDPPPGE